MFLMLPATIPLHYVARLLVYIKEALLEESLTRNLASGEWKNFLESRLKDDTKIWLNGSKELLKKLITKGRLRCVPAGLNNHLANCTNWNYEQWCGEALASHDSEALQGIITTKTVIDKFPNRSKIAASIDKLSSVEWWRSRSPSLRLHRTTNDYLKSLNLVFKCSNSIMFIDPHLSPDRRNYKEFYKLLEVISQYNNSALIEIHRVVYSGSGKDRILFKPEEMENLFRKNLPESIKSAKLKIEVFVWDDFHDRYLISNLIGIKLSNGFDLDDNPQAKTTWARLGRNDRDDIQREFHPASREHKMQYQFSLNGS